MLRKVEGTLKKVYGKYKGKGMISIYLWGSILNEDFDPKNSDIDSIAIVENHMDEKYAKEINKFLKKEQQDLKDFKMNFLFLDELNSGESRSRVAKFIHPKMLLMQFPGWKHVCGKKFNRRDFALKDATNKEAIKYQLRRIDKLPKFKRGDHKSIQYFCKSLLLIVYFSNPKNSESLILLIKRY